MAHSAASWPESVVRTLDLLPHSPGVYQMKDAAGKVLYVGKASSLRNRVRSYFQPGQKHSQRIANMVARVESIDFIVTGNEVEALILEANLIKRHRPRYNILLRDDKRYPYLKLTREPFPQLVECRQISPDGARYFGPYTNAGAMRRIDRLIRKLFHIRRCTFHLTGEPQMRPCLDHHIGLCDAPCAALIDAAAYGKLCDQAAALLEGRGHELAAGLEAEMHQAAASLEFERAAEIRDLLEDLRKITERQRVVSTQPLDADVLAVAQHEDLSCVQVFFVRRGRIVGDHDVTLEGTAEDVPGVPLRAFLTSYYDLATDLPDQLLLGHPIEDAEAVSAWLSDRAGRRVEVAMPERGEKRQLVELVRDNAAEALRAYLADRDQQRQRAEAAASDLRERLGLPRTPFRIECFDIATLQGNQNVASMVVFEDGRPAKGAYRRFRVRLETDAPNDYAMMREVLLRRLQKAADGDPKFLPLPDLLVVDGGKGQLGVAEEVCAQVGLQQIPLAALAKRQEHIFVPGRAEPLVLEGRMPALRLLRALRDEAHRFANTYHQRLRRTASLKSILDDIPGIGRKRRALLLEHFRSTDAIRKASVEELAAVPGMTRPAAEAVKQHLEDETDEAAP